MKLIGKPSVNINQIVPGNVVYHLKNTSIGFANMKGDFWVRVYLVHLVLLVAVPVRSVTVCRVRTEPSSTCGAACVRAAAVRAAHRRQRARSAAASHSAQVRAAQKGRAKAHHSTCAICALWVPLHVPTMAANVKFYLDVKNFFSF